MHYVHMPHMSPPQYYEDIHTVLILDHIRVLKMYTRHTLKKINYISFFVCDI